MKEEKTGGMTQMDKRTTEYTPGQLIRMEAVALYHNGLRLRELGKGNNRISEPAARAIESVTAGQDGKLQRMNRRRSHYEELADSLERTREWLETVPASENNREAWLLLNRCRYHCLTILSMMEKQSLHTGASS